MNVQDKTLAQKIEALPPELRQEVEDFVEFIAQRHMPPREEASQEELDLSWRGALSHLRDEYTSVELQHKASEWRVDD